MKEITAFNLKPLYEITENGEVWSKYKKDWMNIKEGKDGYMTINLVTKEGKYRTCGIHRLVLATYNPIPNMEEFQVNHKDGNKKNNHLDNLEWMTPKQNIIHSWENGLAHHRGDSHGRATISENQAKEIIKMLKEGKKQSEIIKLMGCSRSVVAKIAQGRTWLHLPR